MDRLLPAAPPALHRRNTTVQIRAVPSFRMRTSTPPWSSTSSRNPTVQIRKAPSIVHIDVATLGDHRRNPTVQIRAVPRLNRTAIDDGVTQTNKSQSHRTNQAVPSSWKESADFAWTFKSQSNRANQGSYKASWGVGPTIIVVTATSQSHRTDQGSSKDHVSGLDPGVRTHQRRNPTLQLSSRSQAPKGRKHVARGRSEAETPGHSSKTISSPEGAAAGIYHESSKPVTQNRMHSSLVTRTPWPPCCRPSGA